MWRSWAILPAKSAGGEGAEADQDDRRDKSKDRAGECSLPTGSELAPGVKPFADKEEEWLARLIEIV